MAVLVVLFLILSAGGFLYAAVFDRRYEEALPVSCGICVFILLLAGVCGCLAAGVWIVYVLAAAVYAYSVRTVIRGRRWKETRRNLLTPGFVIFTVAFVVFAFGNRGKLAHEMDAFSHWADVVKTMTLLDDFGTNPAALTEFPSYPPGIALFQYLYQKTEGILRGSTGSTIFNEGNLYQAYQVFLAAFLVPVFSKLSHRKPLTAVLCSICVFLAPVCLYYNTYDSLLVDSMIGILSGAGMAMLLTTEPDDRFGTGNILAATAMLCLVKDAGLLFAAFLAAGLILRKVCAKKNGVETARTSAFAVASIALPKLLWEIEIAVSGVQRSFSNPFDLGLLAETLSGKGTGYRVSVLPHFVEKYILGTVEFRNIGLNITYPALLLFSFIGLYLLVIHFRKNQDGKLFRKIWFWLLFAQTVFYTAGLCAAYMFKFTAWEAGKLDSFDRYLRIGYQAVWMALILILAWKVQTVQVRKTALSVILLCTVICSVPIGPVVCFVSRDNVANSIEERQEFVQMTEKIRKTVPAGEPVFVMESRHDYGYAYRGIRYLIRPMATQHENIRIWCLDGPNNSEDQSCTPKEWAEELNTFYNYVAIYDTDAFFVEHYSSVFADPEDIRPESLYAVNHDTGLLERIA